MIASPGCQLIGRWRIVESDLWDREYLDLVEPAYIEIDTGGRGAFAFGAVNATLELKHRRGIAVFRWSGFDEGDEVSGSGAIAPQEDGTIEIDLSFDDGDDATLKACRP